MNKEEIEEGCEFCGLKENCPNYYLGKEEARKEFIDLLYKSLEGLSELEHLQWGHLAKYLIDLVEDDKSVYEKLEDWKVLAHTNYNKLSEKDKDKDRVWAKKVIILLEQLSKKTEEEKE
jgi:hypothetical protein